MSNSPELFVFDLDYTLWPFWCDTHISPPFTSKGERLAEDRCGYKIKLYRDVVEIIQDIQSKSIPIAIASRTHDPEIAEELLKLLDLNDFITYKEIYPGSKLTHFGNIKKNSGIEYKDTFFFDDEMRNIKEIGKLGVTCQFLEKGVTWADMKKALENFRSQLC